MPPHLFRAAFVAALVLAPAAPAAAQFTWDGGGTSNGWVDPLNWAGNVVPPSSPATAIVLVGTTQTTTVQDIAPTFQLNSLAMDANSATGGFVVNPSNGSRLQFAGAAPTITYTGAGSGVSSALVLNTDLDFGAASVGIAINGLSGTGTFYEVIVGGRLAGTGTITRSNTGSLATDLLLRGANGTFSGTFDNGGGGGGITILGAVNVFGRGVALSTGSSALAGVNTSVSGASGQQPTAAAFNQQFGSLTGTGQLTFGNATAGSTVLVGFNQTLTTDATTFAGQLNASTVTGGGPVAHFGKVGAGTLTLTASSSGLTGQFSVRDGTVVLSGSGNLGSASTTPPAGGLPIAVAAGAELRAVTGTSTNGRLQNNAAVTLSGGTLRLDASGVTAAGGVSEVVGVLSAAAGQSTVAIATNAGGTSGARFSFASLAAPGAGATLFFQANNLGVAASTTANTGAANVAFTTAPTALLGVNAGGTATFGPTARNLLIFPFAVASAAAGGAPATFVTYDATITTAGSVRRLEDANYALDFGVSAENVSLATAGAANDTTANALRLTTGGSVAVGGGGLVLTSGAFLNAGGGNVTGTGAVTFGAPATGTAFLTATGAATFSAPVAAANVSKNGAGPLTLGAVNLSAASGPRTVAVNAGTLALTAAVAPGDLSATNTLTYQVSRGATLDVPAGLAVGANTVLTGNGTVAGTTTVTAGGVIAPAGLPGPGTLTVGNLALAGGSTLRVALSSGLTDVTFDSPYTAGQVAVTGALDLTGASAGTPITIAPVSLGLNNAAGPVYDLVAGESYTWRVVRTGANGITGFDPAKFVIDASAFANTGGTFGVTASTDSLFVTYAVPIPEPATVLGLAALGLAGVRGVRRRRAAARRGDTPSPV